MKRFASKNRVWGGWVAGFDYAVAGTRTSVPPGQYVAGGPDSSPQGMIDLGNDVSTR